MELIENNYFIREGVTCYMNICNPLLFIDTPQRFPRRSSIPHIDVLNALPRLGLCPRPLIDDIIPNLDSQISIYYKHPSWHIDSEH